MVILAGREILLDQLECSQVSTNMRKKAGKGQHEDKLYGISQCTFQNKIQNEAGNNIYQYVYVCVCM